jgi:hypothetical protein
MFLILSDNFDLSTNKVIAYLEYNNISFCISIALQRMMVAGYNGMIFS